MAIADDLLTLAGHLSVPAATDPERAWLRRSISTAYYALFQRLVQSAAQRWTGTAASRLGLERTFKHDQMKEVSRAVSTGSWRGWSTPQLPVPLELREIAKSFIGLQEARHQADYSNEKSWTQTEVAAKLSDARTAFQNWKKIDGSPAADRTCAESAFISRKSRAALRADRHLCRLGVLAVQLARSVSLRTALRRSDRRPSARIVIGTQFTNDRKCFGR
jgi:hypothetical protein